MCLPPLPAAEIPGTERNRWSGLFGRAPIREHDEVTLDLCRPPAFVDLPHHRPPRRSAEAPVFHVVDQTDHTPVAKAVRGRPGFWIASGSSTLMGSSRGVAERAERGEAAERHRLLFEDAPCHHVTALAEAAHLLGGVEQIDAGQFVIRVAREPVRQEVLADPGERGDALGVAGEMRSPTRPSIRVVSTTAGPTATRTRASTARSSTTSPSAHRCIFFFSRSSSGSPTFPLKVGRPRCGGLRVVHRSCFGCVTVTIERLRNVLERRRHPHRTEVVIDFGARPRGRQPHLRRP